MLLVILMKIIKYILLFIGYIFYIIIHILLTIYEFIYNLISFRDRHSIDDIIEVKLLSFPDGDMYEFKKDELSEQDYKKILDSIEKNNILKLKKYIIESPFISFNEYCNFYDIDGGPSETRTIIEFKDGKAKVSYGYNKRINNLENVLSKI